MKKVFYVLMCVCVVSMSQAALLSYDPFDSTDYVDGDLDGQNPTIAGYTSAWTATNWGDQHVLYSAGKAGVPSGSPEIAQGNSGRVYRSLDSALVADATTDGTLYLGFVFQSGQETGATTYQMLHLNQGTNGDANRAFDIGLTNNGGLSGTQYDFGVNGAYSSTGVDADTAAHLLIVKFDLSSTAASDSVTVWVDPLSEVGGTIISGVDLVWDSLMLSDYDGNSASWDNIKWGTAFGDVVSVPEPATLALLGLGGLVLRRKR